MEEVLSGSPYTSHAQTIIILVPFCWTHSSILTIYWTQPTIGHSTINASFCIYLKTVELLEKNNNKQTKKTIQVTYLIRSKRKLNKRFTTGKEKKKTNEQPHRITQTRYEISKPL